MGALFDADGLQTGARTTEMFCYGGKTLEN
jgi:hypothetical protein